MGQEENLAAYISATFLFLVSSVFSIGRGENGTGGKPRRIYFRHSFFIFILSIGKGRHGGGKDKPLVAYLLPPLSFLEFYVLVSLGEMRQRKNKKLSCIILPPLSLL